MLYLTAFELIEAFEKHTFGNTGDNEDSLYEDTLFDSILNCDALIIDDLGTETVNNFTVSQLFSLPEPSAAVPEINHYFNEPSGGSDSGYIQ